MSVCAARFRSSVWHIEKFLSTLRSRKRGAEAESGLMAKKAVLWCSMIPMIPMKNEGRADSGGRYFR